MEKGTSMTAAISSLGVGSNLDLSSLLDSLQTDEEKRLDPITAKQTSYNAKLTAYGTLQSALEAFSTASAALADPTLYTQKVASTSDNFTTDIGANAVSGSYSISIQQLASAQSLVTQNVASDTSTALGGTADSSGRTLSIQVGSGAAVNISLTDAQTSLSGLRDAINGANAGVTASIMQSGDSGYQLVVTSNATGENSGITMSVSGDDTLNGILGYSGGNVDPDTASVPATGMKETTQGKDALLTVNGVSVDRSSNTISDVPQGVTLTLNSVTTSTQNLVLRQSVTGSDKAIDDWMTAYNTLLTTFNSLDQYTAVAAGDDQSTTNGVLLGDSVLNSVKEQISSVLSSAQSSPTFKVLSQLGITVKDDYGNADNGTLSADETTLIKNLSDNPTAVSAFFVGDGKTTGLATQMVNIANTFTASDGVIDGATDSINSILTGLSKQYTQVQTSIDADIARYKTQFTQLDVLMSSLNQTSTFLTQQFNAMSGVSNSSSSSSS
jgi:flagellar hook-associated protein 2